MFKPAKIPARAFLALALIAAIRFADLPVLAPVAHGQKPMFPVFTRLEMLNAPDPGGAVRVLAAVTAWAPGETIHWKLEVPPGLAVIDGVTSWSGELDRGATRLFEVILTVPDGALHEVSSIARIEGRDARGAAMLPIDLGGYEGPRGLEQVVTGNGTTYIQYPGETLPRDGGDR